MQLSLSLPPYLSSPHWRTFAHKFYWHVSFSISIFDFFFAFIPMQRWNDVQTIARQHLHSKQYQYKSNRRRMENNSKHHCMIRKIRSTFVDQCHPQQTIRCTYHQRRVHQNQGLQLHFKLKIDFFNFSQISRDFSIYSSFLFEANDFRTN